MIKLQGSKQKRLNLNIDNNEEKSVFIKVGEGNKRRNKKITRNN